ESRTPRSSGAGAARDSAAAPHGTRRSNTIVQGAADNRAHEASPLMPALTHAPDALEEANRPPGPPHRCRHTAPPALATELDAGLSQRTPRALPPANLPLPPPAGQAVGGSLPSTSRLTRSRRLPGSSPSSASLLPASPATPELAPTPSPSAARPPADCGSRRRPSPAYRKHRQPRPFRGLP